MNKGQSSFELLTTYGWVFLSVLMVAATLAFLNITNPQIFLSEECIVDDEFACIEYGIFEGTTNTSVLLLLRNRVEEPLRDKTSLACSFGDNTTEVNFGKDLSPGETIELICEGPVMNWRKGAKQKVNFKIVYYTNNTARGIPQVANGYLYAEVK